MGKLLTDEDEREKHYIQNIESFLNGVGETGQPLAKE